MSKSFYKCYMFYTFVIQFSGCWLILSVYIIMSFDFPFVRLFGVRYFCYYPYILFKADFIASDYPFGIVKLFLCHIVCDVKDVI